MATLENIETTSKYLQPLWPGLFPQYCETPAAFAAASQAAQPAKSAGKVSPESQLNRRR
jgi:hypothetical protein